MRNPPGTPEDASTNERRPALTGTSHLQEVEYLRSWVTERWQFVRDNYVSDL